MTDATTDQVAGLRDLIEGSRQDHERLQAAVIRVAAGRLDLLDQAVDLAQLLSHPG